MRNTLILAFSRPSTWWGWATAYYQLLRGVKFWQIVHVELLAPEGIYAYRINAVLHGEPNEFPCNVSLTIDPTISAESRLKRSRYIHRMWGDFSPLSVLNGNNCTRYVCFLCDLRDNTLPGQLLWDLTVLPDIPYRKFK